MRPWGDRRRLKARRPPHFVAPGCEKRGLRKTGTVPPRFLRGDCTRFSGARAPAGREYEVRCRPLERGKALEGVSGDDQVQYFHLAPKERAAFRVTLSGMDDNCDLYLRAGLPPTFRIHDAKSVRAGTADEALTMPRARSATYYLAVHGRHGALNGARYTLAWDEQ